MAEALIYDAAKAAAPVLQADSRAILENDSAPLELRLPALHDCLLNDAQKVGTWLGSQLARPDLPDDWRDALVLAAEDCHFADSQLQQAVCDRLLEIAAALQHSTNEGANRIVWSAVRRAASLLKPEDAPRLLPFLDRPGPIDARLVALQGIGRIFELAPPTTPEVANVLGERVAAFASKFLDPDVFEGGERGAIAWNAVYTLATLGDERLATSIGQVRQLKRRWLTRQVHQQLQQLLASWKARDVGLVSHPAYRLAESQLAVLQS